MKNAIYIVLGTVLVLCSLIVLFLYYTQDFTEDFDFPSAIEYKDVVIQSEEKIDYYSTDKEPKNFLREAKAYLGALNLENNGYFTQEFKLPRLVGCLELSENVDKNSKLYLNDRFSIYIGSYGDNYKDPNYYQPSSAYGRSSTSIKVKVGEEKKLDIIGIYSYYNVLLSDFSLVNIKGISIYEIPDKEDNPLSEGSYYDYDYNYNSCKTIKSELKPLAKINLISGE